VPGSEALSSDVAPLGDSTDVTSNNNSWSTLAPGDTVTFTASYTVSQADIDNQ
jgi:large repetitive protein